jgi:hypothetical protein
LSNTTTRALRICLVVACLSGGDAISTCLSRPYLIFAPGARNQPDAVG